jgi:hypothetical protein
LRLFEKYSNITPIDVIGETIESVGVTLCRWRIPKKIKGWWLGITRKKQTHIQETQSQAKKARGMAKNGGY